MITKLLFGIFQILQRILKDEIKGINALGPDFRSGVRKGVIIEVKGHISIFQIFERSELKSSF